MPAKKQTAKTTTAKKKTGTFSIAEREAMRERAREAKAEADGQDGERDLQAKIAGMAPADRALAKQIHAIILENAPSLRPKTWYGMPAYARADKIVCFFQPAGKFKARYSTLGFNDSAKLDDGAMWPTAFALTKLDAADEKRIAALVKKAAG